MICVMSLFNLWPLLLQSVSIVTYIGFGNIIDLQTVFTVIALAQILRGPVGMLPWFMGQMIEFLVSMKRIQRFLLCQEIQPAMITQRGDPDLAISINNPGTFHWGLEDPEEKKAKEEEAQKKALK